MILALAVLFASSFTGAAAASAAAMPAHDMQMLESGHCSSAPVKEDGKAPVKSCCMAMCMAIAIEPPAPAEMDEIHHQTTYFAVPTSWHGYLGEIATPPPRAA